MTPERADQLAEQNAASWKKQAVWPDYAAMMDAAR